MALSDAFFLLLLLSFSPSFSPLQGDHMDREAMKCQVLTVSNHSCESLTLVGNTLECTVPTELQAATAKELQVEVRHTCATQTPRHKGNLHVSLH